MRTDLAIAAPATSSASAPRRGVAKATLRQIPSFLPMRVQPSLRVPSP